MNKKTDEYNSFESKMYELGIDSIDFVEPDFIRKIIIQDASQFNNNQLDEILALIEEKALELNSGAWSIRCITSANLEDQIRQIELLKTKIPNLDIMIDGSLSSEVIVENIDIREFGDETSYLGTPFNKSNISLDELHQISQIMKSGDLDEHEAIHIVHKFNLDTGEDSQTINTGVIGIDNITQLSKEHALEIKKSGKYKSIYVRNCGGSDEYDLDEYIQIVDAMQNIVGDIPSELPEQEKFAIVYERICENIQYDDIIAASSKTKEEEEYENTVGRKPYNLLGGLLEGKSVCQGYSVILRNALISCGIECESVFGYGHAWNKVSLNGEWFNVDATWDRENIMYREQPKYALKSDKFVMEQHDGDFCFGGPKCKRNATPEELDSIFQTRQIKEIIEYLKKYPQYKKYVSTSLGKEIIELMRNNGENDAEILNWDENIIENGTSIDLIKEEIYRANPSWREYKKTEVGIAIMRLIEAGEDEQALLEYDDNPYFEENGISISKMQEEIHRQNRKREEESKKRKNPIEDVGASKIMLSSVKEVTSQIRNNLTVSKEKENARE